MSIESQQEDNKEQVNHEKYMKIALQLAQSLSAR